VGSSKYDATLTCAKCRRWVMHVKVGKTAPHKGRIIQRTTPNDGVRTILKDSVRLDRMSLADFARLPVKHRIAKKRVEHVVG